MSSGLVMDEFGEVPDVGEVLLTIPIPSTTTFSSSHTDKYCNIYDLYYYQLLHKQKKLFTSACPLTCESERCLKT